MKVSLRTAFLMSGGIALTIGSVLVFYITYFTNLRDRRPTADSARAAQRWAQWLQYDHRVSDAISEMQHDRGSAPSKLEEAIDDARSEEILPLERWPSNGESLLASFYCLDMTNKSVQKQKFLAYMSKAYPEWSINPGSAKSLLDMWLNRVQPHE